MGESIILEALEIHTGYSKLKLKELIIQLGDIGDVGYVVTKYPKQKRIC